MVRWSGQTVPECREQNKHKLLVSASAICSKPRPNGVVQRQRARRAFRAQYEPWSVDQLHALSSHRADQVGCGAQIVGRSHFLARHRARPSLRQVRGASCVCACDFGFEARLGDRGRSRRGISDGAKLSDRRAAFVACMENGAEEGMDVMGEPALARAGRALVNRAAREKLVARLGLRASIAFACLGQIENAQA